MTSTLNNAAAKGENGHADAISLLESGEWSELVQWVATPAGKTQVEHATLLAVSKASSENHGFDSARRGAAPLHLALQKVNPPTPESVLLALLESYPQAARLEQGVELGLPLHVALANEMGTPSECLTRLMDLYPEALEIANGSGQLPLHVALTNGTGVSKAVIRMLVVRYPKALETANGLGQLPLHVALDLKPYVSLGVVRYLVEEYPQALSIPTTTTGKLPLWVAVTNTSGVGLAVLQFLVERYPEALSTVDAISGRLPLHAAVANEICCCHQGDESEVSTVVEFLLESHPAALSVPDKDRLLPLTLACCNPKSSVQVLYRILRSYPSALEESTDKQHR